MEWALLPPKLECPDLGLHALLVPRRYFSAKTVDARVLPHRLQPLKQRDDVIVDILVRRQA